ncbi:carboxypeptidase-like regulatory domain-containing protein [Haloarcula salinisoli]|uniref:Carboxypeptidase-like regulatory domain-containing protein n=1 Tax=Haloarcula salinisoli TaxID=2487746 RepID=A0A8J8C6B3_9EURY|nr:carboxypeptidase-like regulatory domain-containing protein [Halomicroarcula salinisoli]MBX0286444.1 carboxypeptidase-like regulatory domain-containing protein [Halomicroarcula salinisoli]MBX0302067.1 carboxypeptidase-like regulatory domain-containing protein [Halomicroarcula salinisoli]
MGSTRLSVGLCIVMLAGVVAVLPAAVTAQQGPVVITATIVDQDGQSVGGGVEVTATWDGGSTNETTLSDGRIRFEAPRGADVSVRVNDDQYIRNNAYVISNATEQSVEVPVSESGTATVTVRNTANETVEDARVLLYRGSDGFVTDQRTGADGTVTTPAVEQGDYRLDIYKDGYFNNRTRVTVGDQTDIDRTIEQGEVLLTVEVVDDYFEPPESLNSSVRISNVATLQTTGGDAATTVPVNTDYDIVVTKDGYDRTTQTISVKQSDITETISINRTDTLSISTRDRVLLGNPITLAVTDEYGDAVSGATVSQDGQQVGTTDDDGEFETDTESAGPVNFTVDDGEAQEEVTVEVVEAPEELTGTPISTSTPTPTATGSEPTETSGGLGPGFTPVTVAAALALLSLVAYRRR